MIDLPVRDKKFEYENDFYLSCDTQRLAKFAAQYELYRMAQKAAGDIVECGIFKGASFARFAAFRKMFNDEDRRLVGFDVFGKFPEAQYEEDRQYRDNFVKEAGSSSISAEQLLNVLEQKGINQNIELIEGDLCQTAKTYAENNPKRKIALLHLDVDLYEPSKAVLEYFYPMMSEGGVLILDDYKNFPGETKAAEEFISRNQLIINKFDFCDSPHYVIKQ